jgi:hypothetical protein
MKNRFNIGAIWHYEKERAGQIVKRMEEHNVMPMEMLNALLTHTFVSGETSLNPWYIAPFESDHTPVETDSYAVPGFTECTAYDESNRQLFIGGTALSGEISNVSNKVQFTWNDTKTIYGGMLTNIVTKGDTSDPNGLIASAAKFAASDSVVSGEISRIWVSITAANQV